MKKPFTVIAIVLLALIAILQLLRFILGWEVSVRGGQRSCVGERDRLRCCRGSRGDGMAGNAPVSRRWAMRGFRPARVRAS